ncbi:Hypothetical predicted protein [Mytilus galloprovincialis]|uniref:Reverse transcriptase domain-containing protein n=1 Tax=Mytilus galloprovincialis TaxID=29158 RepID=A0A8B6C343_MYTGA|nr:Hypothetical predicted protein [Mytilus galloprovincialis]
MSDPAEINMLIDRKIKDAMSQNQNEILQSIDRLMSSRLDTFQRSVHETQRQLSETQMSKIQQMNTENYVFKRKGKEEQFKVNTKIANKMKEARSSNRNAGQQRKYRGAMRNICERFKYEDASVASQMFKKGDYCFTYDLRSAYHHVEIFESHKTYLGFTWVKNRETKYYVFNVLPFGISTAGYIFTKVVRCIVKYLRNSGLKIIMYLDDGFGGADEISQAQETSIVVQKVLKASGFLIAEDKCNWTPSQNVVWLVCMAI